MSFAKNAKYQKKRKNAKGEKCFSKMDKTSVIYRENGTHNTFASTSYYTQLVVAGIFYLQDVGAGVDIAHKYWALQLGC